MIAQNTTVTSAVFCGVGVSEGTIVCQGLDDGGDCMLPYYMHKLLVGRMRYVSITLRVKTVPLEVAMLIL